MPSMADVDADNVSDPDTGASSTGAIDLSARAKQFRRRFADTVETSGESNLPPPDLESIVSETEDESTSYNQVKTTEGSSKGDLKRARELYAELQQMSNETGAGSIEDIIDNLATSTESITSLIPQEKRQELNK